MFMWLLSCLDSRKDAKASKAWESIAATVPPRPTNTTDYLAIAKYCTAVDAANEADSRMASAKMKAARSAQRYQRVRDFGPRWMWSYLPYAEFAGIGVLAVWMAGACPDTLASVFNVAFQSLLFVASNAKPVIDAVASINGEQFKDAAMKGGVAMSIPIGVFAALTAILKTRNYFSSVRVPRVPVDAAAIEEQLMDMAFTTTDKACNRPDEFIGKMTVVDDIADVNRFKRDPRFAVNQSHQGTWVVTYKGAAGGTTYGPAYTGILSRTDPNKLTAKERRWLRRNPPPVTVAEAPPPNMPKRRYG
jgi:hypothetical protein